MRHLITAIGNPFSQTGSHILIKNKAQVENQKSAAGPAKGTIQEYFKVLYLSIYISMHIQVFKANF